MPPLLPRHARAAQRLSPPVKRRRARARLFLLGCVVMVACLLALGRRKESGESAAERAAAPPPPPSTSGRRPCDRGIPAADAPRFCSAPAFTCDDGSATLDPSAINDGYCDCPDGSDERGTAGCAGVGVAATLWFECPTAGAPTAPPVRISRALLDDGVVDCPGGEDEWKGGG